MTMKGSAIRGRDNAATEEHGWKSGKIEAIRIWVLRKIKLDASTSETFVDPEPRRSTKSILRNRYSPE
jgi:hypothetical protein